MEKRAYFGIVHIERGGPPGVSFPDFPGCVSVADNVVDLAESGAEALQFHIDGMIEDGLPIPEPTDMKTAREGAFCLIRVEVKVPVAAVKRFNITARESDINAIDTYLKKRGQKRDRSEFLVSSALQRIRRETRYAEAEQSGNLADTRTIRRSDRKPKDPHKEMA